MGVRGLQTFIERDCPPAWSVVRIKDLATNFCQTSDEAPMSSSSGSLRGEFIMEEHSKESDRKPEILVEQTGRNATVVIDGNSCLRTIYSDLDWIHGGQYQDYMARLTDFINFFLELKISLVFFFDGPTVDRKRPVWCTRRENAQKDVDEVYRLLRAGCQVSKVPGRLFQIPPSLGLATRNFLKSHPQCAVFTSVQECDEEVVQFAVHNDCFAILGQDSDYIIFEGSYYYLSVNHLDLRSGTTYLYDRCGLARGLRIETFALPLLASLVGNDVISKEQLSKFHFSLCGRQPRSRELFHTLARYIRRFRYPRDIWRALPEISVDVFGTKTYVPLLKSSLLSYKPYTETSDVVNLGEEHMEWLAIVQTAKRLMKSNMLMVAVYGVVANHTFEMSASLEDKQCLRFPPIAVLYLSIRKRVYGILLEQCTTHNPVVREFCANKNKALLQHEEILADPVPYGLHTGMLTLWDKTIKAPVLEQRRWSLFVWGLTGTLQLPIQRLMELPEKFIAVVAVCHYLALAKPRFLEEWELCSLLVQAILLQSITVGQPLRVPPTDLHCVNLAAMFLRGVQHVLFLANTVGLSIPDSELNPVNFFDGILFNQVYNDMKRDIPVYIQLGKKHPSMKLFLEMKNLALWNTAS